MPVEIKVIKEIYTDHFQEVYRRGTPELMEIICHKIMPFTEEIAANFYLAMLGVRGSKEYLGNELVAARLKEAFSQWVCRVFILRGEVELESYIEEQLQIGQVHARINLPPHLFNCSIRILKQLINSCLRKGDISLKDYNSISTYAGMLIDVSTSLMNESFFGEIVIGERKSQSMQMHMTGGELALKCEQLKTELFSWFATILGLFREGNIIDVSAVPSCSHSGVGLWINHKATMFFPDSSAVTKLQKKITLLDKQVEKIIFIYQENELNEANNEINKLEDLVKEAMFLLSLLVEQSIAMDSGRDTLTRLFNRRYLETVLQKETHFCMVNNKTYILLLLDIDHFKKVNDTYGHDAGDRVLEQMGELLGQELRAGDFVFRYGGEEFLILLTEMKLEYIAPIAEKILKNVRSHQFKIGKEEIISCTISIGIAAHQGLPDYSRVISNADKALYEAKESGRNKYIVNGLNTK